MAIAGPPLVKVATGEDSDDESLGGAEMHAEVSGLADYLAADELDAIRMCRQVVGHLNWRKRGHPATLPADEPLYDPEDLLGVVSRDLRQPVEIRDVIARIVDGSRFDEFKARYGTTLVCGWASLHGYPIGILGNNGVLFPDSSEKGCQFIQLCNQIDVPILFLHNITGFMVGKEYERAGLVKKGSLLINAVSNSTVPHLSVVIGSSFGAGLYGMSGRAFGNRFTFLWPTAKIAVMGPKQISGVMSIVRRGRAQRLGEEIDEEEDRDSSRRRRDARAKAPSRWRSPAPSPTTASSTPATPAPCLASASLPSTTKRSRGPLATACSGHDSAWRQPACVERPMTGAKDTPCLRVANCSGFYGDRLSAAERDGRGRADRRPHRRLARRADDADPRQEPHAGPRRRLRPHVRHADGTGDGDLPRPRHQGRDQRRRAQPGGLRGGGAGGRRQARAVDRRSPTSRATTSCRGSPSCGARA